MSINKKISPSLFNFRQKSCKIMVNIGKEVLNVEYIVFLPIVSLIAFILNPARKKCEELSNELSKNGFAHETVEVALNKSKDLKEQSVVTIVVAICFLLAASTGEKGSILCLIASLTYVIGALMLLSFSKSILKKVDEVTI